MSDDTFTSVWDAITDTTAEAENMRLRSELMMALERYIKKQGRTQAESARQLGVTQPRVSDLMRGKIQLFSLDTLVGMVAAVGLRVEMHVAA
ncbi:XRE family transcriptional regulator [Pistricoccus aurantiacus]|uniref:XRE family transcriptional regulator n=1 Tax=Pistricoccus aurantiacus TaxID=1883414 RepID=A0A5B8SZP6_9GAMM|nr:XRE family transcriptional regulator [Pistricoccus aurantiacus]QEA40278.1 XRE family transcriptional regulator [Pistricoccus aurantiacus]